MSQSLRVTLLLMPLAFGCDSVSLRSRSLARSSCSEPAGEVTNIFLPAPRGLAPAADQARKALEEQQFSGAVDLLGQLLASGDLIARQIRTIAGEQDYFLSGPTNRGRRSA